MLRSGPDMTCDDVAARLGAYLDGELSEQAADEVRRHLEGCPACVRRQEQAFALAAAIRAEVPYHRLGDEARTRIRQTLARRAAPGVVPVAAGGAPVARRW